MHNLNGQQYYFDTKTGIMVTNRYVYDDQGNWYYFGKDGRALHGFQTVDGNLHYFNDSGQQVKGDFLYYNNDIYYFDKDNGNPVTNQFVNRDDAWYYFEADGKEPSLVSKPLTDRTYVSTNMAFKPRDNWLLLTAKPTTSIQIQVTSGLIVHLP